MTAIVLCAALLLGQSSLESVVGQAETLSKTYLDRGQTAADKTAVLEFFTAHDRAFGGEAAYLLAKFRILSDIGESERAWDVFDLIPDAALTAPTDLANRLRSRLTPNPAAALPLARRLASVSEPAFVRWFHQSLAQSYAPVIRDTVNTPAHDAFLAALAESEPAASTASALRMWREAQRTNDAATLRTLAGQSITARNAFAPRYQLLLADRLEARAETASDGGALRQRVIAAVSDELRALPQDDERRPRDRYWLAYACAARARAAERSGDRATALAALRDAAAYSPDADDRRMQHLFAYEKATLGGQAEYRSAYAGALEAAGQLDEALATRTDIAKLDARQLAPLQQLFARIRPGQSFERYWIDVQLAGRPTAPEFSLPTPSGSTVTLASFRGRWVLLDFWGTWCQPCQAEMPDVEATAREHPGHVLTLAAHDTAETVTRYMTQRRYTFPVVVLSDEAERAFNVPYYPFKLLVAPDGRTLPLFNETWRADVGRYLDIK
jgi:thiol-disulfide isomerase/thioredoxin